MNIGVIEMYFLILLVFICIFILRRDSVKYAETKNITRLDIDNEDGGRREFVASGLNDHDYHGSKILIILYSLFCRRCNSTDIFAEIAESDEHIQVYCRKCGYTTLIPLKKLLIHDELDADMTSMNEQEMVKAYLHKLHEKHVVDIIDPEPIEPKSTNKDPKDAK